MQGSSGLRCRRVFVIALLAVVALCLASEDEEDDTFDSKPSEERVHKAKHTLESVDGWLATDKIQVYNAEFLLASWVLDAAPWNAYHSGIAFRNNRTGGKALYDFTPDDTSSVMKMVIPGLKMDNMWRAAILGDVQFRWSDGAHLEFHTTWPAHFTTFTSVGWIDGAAMFNYTEWVAKIYMPKFKSFNPVEVAFPPQKPGDKGRTALRSRMCHDFVTDSLWVMYENGAEYKVEDAIFRDHIIMYAERMEIFDGFEESSIGKRKELRYLRTLYLYLEKIKAQFTYGREALQVIWRLGLPTFVHDEQGNYQQVKLVPPFLNYCYLPLSIPPAEYDVFTATKLCALGVEANLTNVTTPFPMAHALAAENRLDQPEVMVSILLTALTVAVVASYGQSSPV